MGRCRNIAVVVSALAVAGCGPGDAAAPAPTPGRQDVQQVTCGRPMPAGTAGWRLTGRFPAEVPASAGTVTGTVTVTGGTPVRGVTGPGAEAFLVRDGAVVTAPPVQDGVGTRWDVPAGEPKDLPALGLLVSCAAPGGPLAPGRYELYARVAVIPDDGSAVAAVGGPWPVEVR